MKTLKDVKVGETATVARLHGEGPVKRRIMDMGITKGVQLHVRKVAPRHYEAEFKLVYDGVEPVAEHQITERYIALLEAMIRESPELWMWSHRRWKHKKPADYDMRHSRDTETHNIPEA